MSYRKFLAYTLIRADPLIKFLKKLMHLPMHAIAIKKYHTHEVRKWVIFPSSHHKVNHQSIHSLKTISGSFYLNIGMYIILFWILKYSIENSYFCHKPTNPNRVFANYIIVWKDFILLDSKRNNKIYSFNLDIICCVYKNNFEHNVSLKSKLSLKVHIIQSFSSICVHFGLSNVVMIKLLYCRGLGSWIRASYCVLQTFFGSFKNLASSLGFLPKRYCLIELSSAETQLGENFMQAAISATWLSTVLRPCWYWTIQ